MTVRLYSDTSLDYKTMNDTPLSYCNFRLACLLPGFAGFYYTHSQRRGQIDYMYRKMFHRSAAGAHHTTNRARR